MRVNIDATTILIAGALGFAWWKWQGAALGPPSSELLSYAGEQVRPPIWEGWGLTDWSVDPYSAEEAAKVEQVAENLNNQLGWNSGSLGSL